MIASVVWISISVLPVFLGILCGHPGAGSLGLCFAVDLCIAQAELLCEVVSQQDSVWTRQVEPATTFGLIDALLGVYVFKFQISDSNCVKNKKNKVTKIQTFT
jgi:hypothetical protein